MVLFAASFICCAAPRLDPEKNQALTFVAIDEADAGVPEQARPLAHSASPSQLSTASAVSKEGSAESLAKPISCTTDPPDPKPTSTRGWIRYEFALRAGQVTTRSTRILQLPKMRESERVVGQYAVELWIGCELLDRVRFNFPLELGDPANRGTSKRPLHSPPSFTSGSELSAVVWVPNVQRATRVELVNRIAGTRTALVWPPNPSVDGGESPKEAGN